MATDEEQYNVMSSLPHAGLLVNLIMRRAEFNIETTATDYSDGEYEDMIEYSDDDAYSGGDGDMIEYGDDDTYSGGGFGSVPASSDEIARLEKAKVGDTREAECAVCMESFQEGADIRKLPCSHGFHERCISDWLRSAVSARTAASRCPLTISGHSRRQRLSIARSRKGMTMRTILLLWFMTTRMMMMMMMMMMMKRRRRDLVST
jgi:hypothetical protein